MKAIKHQIKTLLEVSEDPIRDINELREYLHEISPVGSQPIDYVKWIPIDKVKPNDYNPNSVAKIEMGLLYKSIKHDGYTQPVVTIYDEANDEYIIVDGFHRYFTCKHNEDIQERNRGYLQSSGKKKD